MKSLLRHPLFVTIIGTVLGTVIVSYINSISMIKAFKAIYDFILNGIVSVLTFSVPIYAILLLIILVVFVFNFMSKANNEVDRDSPLNYKQDVIEDIKWVWGWTDLYGGHDFSGHTPVPLCNHCKGNLIVKEFNYDNYLYCENCGFKKKISEGYRDYQDKIKREIYRRIRVKFD